MNELKQLIEKLADYIENKLEIKFENNHYVLYSDNEISYKCKKYDNMKEYLIENIFTYKQINEMSRLI